MPAAPSGGPPVGAWKATITADAGAGRTAAVPVDFTVVGPEPAPSSAEAWPTTESLPPVDLSQFGRSLPPSRSLPLPVLLVAVSFLAGALLTLARELGGLLGVGKRPALR